MTIQDDAPRQTYSGTTKTFHWLTAALVLTAWPIGFTMIRLAPGPVQDQLYKLHWSLGATILTVAALRWIHRLWRRPVTPPPEVPLWMCRTAAAVHWTLYGLLIVVPLLGWAGKSAYGGPITVFGGLFELPPLLAKDTPLGENILAVHTTLALILGGLVALHVAAALQHHFLRGDVTLRRMLPRALGGR